MTERSAVERASARPLSDLPTAETPVVTERDSADDTSVRLGDRIRAVTTGREAARAATTDRPAAPAQGTAVADVGESSASRGQRRARLRLTRIDPWSVMKTSFLLSIAFGIVTVVSVLMVWSVLDAAGVWDSINKAVQSIVGGQDAAGFDVQNYVGTSRVVGFTMVVSVVDVVLLTAIATLGAFLYNMAAALLGGIEVTLAEDA